MQTRDKIIQIALKLFVVQGAHKTSTNQICKEAGIASGTLFVHFKTKQDLIDAIYIEKKKKVFTAMNESLDYSKTVKSVVLDSSEFMINYYLKHFDDFLYFQLLENGPNVSEKARKLYKQEVAESIKIIKDWQSDGDLRSIDTALIMDLWWSMLSAFIRRLKSEKKLKVRPDDLVVVWEALRA